MMTPSSKRFLYMSLLNKIVIYGSLRMIYPLLSFLADDWGLTRTEIGYILGLSEIGGIPAGFLATCGDMYGTRRVGLLSYFIFIIASFLMLVPPTFGGLAVIRILLMTTGTLYAIMSTTAMLQEHAGKGAGWITGISETGWALSSFTLVPVLALIYESYGWRAAFLTVAVLSAILLPEILVDFPTHKVAPRPSSPGEDASSNNNLSIWARFKRSHYVEVICMPGPVFFAMSGFFFSIAHNLTYVIFVNWAVDVYGLSADDMGGASFAIGVAEIVGSVAVIFFADRIGVYWSIYVCNISFFVGLIVFSLYGEFSTASSIVGGVVIICLVMLPGEFSIVAQIAAMDGLVSSKLLSTAMGLNFQLFFAGRAVGAVIADPIWTSGGLVWSGILDAVCVLISLVLLRLAQPHLIKEPLGPGADLFDDEEQPNPDSQTPAKSALNNDTSVTSDDPIKASPVPTSQVEVQVDSDLPTGKQLDLQ